LIIGNFQSTENGFTGKIEGLAIRVNATFTLQAEKEGQPSGLHRQLRLQRHRSGMGTQRRPRFLHPVEQEEPSLAPGSYKLVKTGAEKSYQLLYRKPSFTGGGK